MEKLKILIADDCKALAELEKKYIEKNKNYQIVGLAYSSKDEIEMINKYNPDIVITDVIRKNEDISGFDIILDNLAENKKVKFILITASTIEELLWKYKYDILPSNIVGYLKKPFDWDMLTVEVEKVYISLMHTLENGDSWEKNYYEEKKINLFEKFSEDELSIIKKFGINIENEKCSLYEFEKLKQNFEIYCTYDKINSIEKKKLNSFLNSMKINLLEYNSLVKKMDDIYNKILEG